MAVHPVYPATLIFDNVSAAEFYFEPRARRSSPHLTRYMDGERYMPRILLVDDDADVRLMLEHVLIDAGHQVETAASVDGGKKRLRSGSYDLALLDGKLPDGHGAEIADEASAIGMKVLMLTGYAFTFPAAARERYEVLLKPLRPHELVAAIERALRD